MHPSDCPAWEYANHPKREEILKQRTLDILRGLYEQTFDSLEIAADSREIHRYLFGLLTPREEVYFAGHYRGEDFPCLKYYEVIIPGDYRVGFPSAIVVAQMEILEEEIREGIKSLDTIHQTPNDQISPEDKLINSVIFACGVFYTVLRIHPYANGNGHAARFILWAILGRYGYWPLKFPIEPRPDYPLYTQAIEEYGNGKPELLQNYILQCIIGD
ncbi:MAG TPA: hypothetical protein DEG17_13495 [Cyanobacteria bacterium UBA11149]|nr:hypothetical protein [Cyanobacteria bacterium UBA11367]HBE60863.1 hypothetical protein [Cyanobacteria bacterium UBA11366]HBK63750.1 hypothetical protein [Cyanobacteria bacterium UBA11166]HBR74564.1 hypothetical protein [Cyanobacteria bacterium UBA11159]HBS68638.1 hypothetical protein [Cyanobacteria bacterium UBA11153]HBW89856.1 hypothetical protein [Cyanobacteria bacterium UBA11149]HCA93646.1 hypothetical protein [Cyanobacteria bacterium UBA9226]